MVATLKIDFVSDIACPWCAVGLGALEKALERLGGQVQADLHFQPFELNPHMPPGGQDLGEHLAGGPHRHHRSGPDRRDWHAR